VARSSRLPLRSSSSVKTCSVPAWNARRLAQPKFFDEQHQHARLGVAQEVLSSADW
jgi:hypothetical protein